MADQMVMVSLLGPRSYRPGKGEPTVHYKMGIQSMPREHAANMGLLNRIVTPVAFGQDEQPVAVRVPFQGRFDEKLTTALRAAGYETLDDLRKASRDALTAIPGVGPSAYEKIQAAVKDGTA